MGMYRIIPNIGQYTSFTFQFWMYLKATDPSGSLTDDYCHFSYNFDSQSFPWTTLVTTSISDYGQVWTVSASNVPAVKNTLTVYFHAQHLSDNENCHVNNLKI